MLKVEGVALGLAPATAKSANALVTVAPNIRQLASRRRREFRLEASKNSPKVGRTNYTASLPKDLHCTIAP